MRPFLKIEGKFRSLIYSFITIVRCGTISVIPSLIAHSGKINGPWDLVIFKDYTASKTSLTVAGQKLNNLGVALLSIFIGYFFP